MSWETSREHAEIEAALKAVRAARPPISGKLVGAIVELGIKHAKVRPTRWQPPHRLRPPAALCQLREAAVPSIASRGRSSGRRCRGRRRRHSRPPLPYTSRFVCAQYYKGVVYELERFMRKARPEYRIPAFYLINAVCHASKNKMKDKDQYVARFMEKGMPGFESLAACDEGEKKQIAKVLIFWVDENIFPELFVRKIAKAIGIQLELKDDGPSIEEQLAKRKADEAAAEAAAAAAAANPPPPQHMDPRRAMDPRGGPPGDPRAQQQLLDVPPGIAQR
eukprot:COSAG03_NODE_1889_length_3389_cov_2.183891_2_plen_277_part_01